MTATWHRAPIGHVTSVDWHEWLDCDRRIDPYLVWADLSSFAGFGGFDSSAVDTGGKLPFLIETTERFTLDGPDQPPVCAALEIPGVYLPASRQDKSTRFFTARASPLCVKLLLQSSETVVRFQLGLPRIPNTDSTRPPPFLPPLAKVRKRPDVVLAVLDDAIGFLHPTFRATGTDDKRFVVAGSTRVFGVWNQNVLTRPPPDRNVLTSPPGLGYGHTLSKDWLLSKSRVLWDAAGSTAFDTYLTALDKRVAWSSSSHGSGVAHLAAGQGLEVGKTPLFFVQMPVRTVLDTSGGSLGVHLLDGLRYVIEQASLLFRDDSLGGVLMGAAESVAAPAAAPLLGVPPLEGDTSLPRLVAVVSFGSIAGPHDGTSMIEQAMAELVELRGRMAIVVAAGNAHGSNTHAVLGPKRLGQTKYRATADPSLTRVQPELESGESHEVTWQVPPDNPNASFLEIWMGEGAANGVQVTVQPPGNTEPCFLTVGQASVFAASSQPGLDVPSAGAIFARRVAQGLKGTMVLVAVGATQPFDPLARSTELSPPFEDAPDRHTQPIVRPTGASGDWLITVTNTNTTPIEVRLWTERNDLVGRKRRRQQARLIDDRGRAVQSEQSLGSLANIAPGKGIYVVTGYRLSDGKLAAYASGGASRGDRTSPDIEAPSDRAVSIPGRNVPGIEPGMWTALGGTSAAAPQFAHWLVENWRFWQSIQDIETLIAKLKPVSPDALRDTPPWPDPLPLGTDDAARRGRRRLPPN